MVSALPPVYLQKWVAVKNGRLAACKLCIWVVAVVLVGVSCGIFQFYLAPMEAYVLLQTWPGISAAGGGGCNTVSNLERLNYDPGNSTGLWTFNSAVCARRCSSGLPTEVNDSCTLDSELASQEEDGSVFFATAYVDEVQLRYHGDTSWFNTYFNRWLERLNNPDLDADLTAVYNNLTGSALQLTAKAIELNKTENEVLEQFRFVDSPCPYDVDLTSDASARKCKGVNSYVVRDFMQDFTINIDIQYHVSEPFVDGSLKTVVKSADGSTVKEISGGQVTMSVNEALEAANIDLAAEIPSEVNFPNDPNDGSRPLGLAVGTDIVFLAEVTNDPAGSGAVCELTVMGAPSWIMKKEVFAVDEYGSSRARTYSGVRFSFKTKTSFKAFNVKNLFYLLSICINWLWMPGIIFFWFATSLLGTLSEAFVGYCYEHVDMKKEVDGATARAMSQALLMDDLSDVIQEKSAGKNVKGFTLPQARLRFQEIMKENAVLAPSDQDLLSQFFFDNVCAEQTEDWEAKEAITIEELLPATMSNENLRYFEDVMRVIDPQSADKTALEEVFFDETLSVFSEPRPKPAKDAAKIIPRDSKAILMNRLKLNSSVWVVQRPNLTRIRLGQEALEAQIDQLRAAGDTLEDLANKMEAGE